MTRAEAPGKVILLGEHAVVYGRPAIAVPVTQVRACATVADAPAGQGIIIHAADLGRSHLFGTPIDSADPAFALEATVRHALDWLGSQLPLDLTLTVCSTVPIARGLGSGAAVATALVRALAQHLDRSLTARQVSDLVYQTEILHHGTPSGIDNTVIAFEQPVYFVKGQSIETLQVGQPLWLVIGDTGIASPTKVAVRDVRRAWRKEPGQYEAWFDRIGAMVDSARSALATGDIPLLGRLMDENQELLENIEVSSRELDALIGAARSAGALGAKLCGAGRGGNMIALVSPRSVQDVADAVRGAGAVNIVVTEVEESPRSADGETPHSPPVRDSAPC